MIQLCSIASGSSGNCIYVGTDNTHVLIDSGISGKRIKLGLDAISVNPQQLNGILVTHEHSDHVSGLGVMARRYKMPIYITKKTWATLSQYKTIGKIDNELIRFITPDQPFYIQDLLVSPFKTSHDAVDSVCYTFEKDHKKIGFATDLGIYDDYIINHLKDSHILFIEANHDIKMLQAGGYPYYLKQRILSDVGHLSNELSSSLIGDVYHDELEYIILAHLSKENNHPDVAYLEVKYLLDELKKQSNKEIQLVVARRDVHSELIKI